MGLKQRTKPSGQSTIDHKRLERLRALCLGFEGAAEKVAWGDPTWRIRNKIFAMQKGNYQGGRPSVWFKGETGAQAMLIDAAPDRYFVPPYVGHRGWIGVYLDTVAVEWDELAHLIGRSYQLIRG
ncbi:MAG: MmcQ/YjbR family DNA-binding protein [Deltaproteobacteria bacterium]|nr:MmcQ/YjbR family DNA-binding protein [Deltaproteobacteria bacterium]